MITWERTDNTLHGQEVVIFADGVELTRIWCGQEADDAEIQARVDREVERREEDRA